jgi:HAD superfamily hydrolase (TIGR01509 family)
MIKLIIFDLDGVLVDSRELHYIALNKALSEIGDQYTISKEEHLCKYDALTTTQKLKKLSAEKNLPEKYHNRIWKLKQQKTLQEIDNYQRDYRIIDIFKKLKSQNYKIACATNSIRETSKLMLIRKGFFDYIDFLYSNEDVNNPKPNAEIYMRCMIKVGANPDETVIIEDSHIGRKGAIRSGAHLCAVKDSNDLTFDKINSTILNAGKKSQISPKWQGDKMNVLIPMAGAGSRFEQAGYTFPKPLIDVNGKPMIQRVVENLNIDARHIFIVQKSHYEKYSLQHTLNLISPNCEIVQVEDITEGAACTTLLAKEFINNDEPLILANSDQYVEWESNQFMYSCMADDIDGSILTFRSTHPKWSYAKLNQEGFVVEVAEKKPISDNATVGIYFWKKGSDYVSCAESMINKNIRVNNEFYVCPVYNEALLLGARVKTFNIDKMWGLGTPEDLDTFLKHDIHLP